MKLNLKTHFFPAVAIIFCLSIFTSCKKQDSVDCVIEDINIFDGNEIKEHATVYIKEGKIFKIVNASEKINCKYKLKINGKNKMIIPGMINAHVHIHSRENLKESANAGITTVLELLQLNEDSIPIFKSLHADSSSSYADYYTSGIGADMPDAVIKFYINSLNPFAPKNIKEVERFLVDRIKNKADFIKIFQDSRLPQKFPDTLFDAIINETHKQKLLTVVHAETLRDIRYAVNHGADIIGHGYIDSMATEDDFKNWKSKSIFIIPTLLIHNNVKQKLNPKNYLLTEAQIIDEIGRLHKAGIPLLAGTDSPADGLNYSSDLYKELGLYVKAGLTPLEALKTATTNPAKAYKLKDKGTIKEGMFADFSIINGDVSIDINKLHQIEAVWNRGKKIK
jgi:imidazolonepropionase-like amidohydrolase